MSQSLSIAEWMKALNDAMNEIASTALGLSGCEIVRTSHAIPLGLEGAYLALVGQDDSIQIGLASNAEGCQALLELRRGHDLRDVGIDLVHALLRRARGRVHADPQVVVEA